MYQALCERDTSFDGAFFAGVRTTGIFCRPGCGAKKPRRENVTYFADAAAALRDGFRPCRRCRPLELSGTTPPWVHRLIDLAARSERRVTSGDLRTAGIHPARAARWFQEHFGMTFQAFQRVRRVASALQPIRNGRAVSRAALETGFESESGFRAAFERLFDAAPTRLEPGAQLVHVDWLPTPLGPMLAAACDRGVCFLEFVDRRALAAQIAVLRRRVGAAIVPGAHTHLAALRRELERYFARDLRVFTTPIHAPGTEFQERVWRELRRIPHGETRSYQDVARSLGRASAVRAVAAANGRNRIAIVIPCHRVVGSDGALVGYAGGVWRKGRLLALERGET
jgi:AraC family transcriptional regulator of adaptative response/methylated-DNA-[protein]-cysteine methyltransferase